MIDVYTNILPQFGSGPKDEREFLQMAQKLVDQGVKTVIATPYFNGSMQGTHKHQILTSVEEANRKLQSFYLPLTILPGQRILATAHLLRSSSQEYLTLSDKGKYLFVHMPFDKGGEDFETIAYELQLKELVPVISEPECSQFILKYPQKLYQLVKNGAIVQVSAQSLTGKNGRKAKKAALQFLEHGCVHLVATGADAKSYEKSSLQGAYEVVKKEFGNAKEFMLRENAEAIANGDVVYRERPERMKTQKFLGVF